MQAEQVFFAYNRQEAGDPGQFRVCPFCGTHLTSRLRGGEQRPTCPNCGYMQFRNPSPGVVILVEEEGRVLLGRRTGSYGAGQWGLPMGFIEHGEDYLTAALREVKEETGLEVEIRSILSVVSNFLSPRLHTLAIVLLARVAGGRLQAGDDLERVEWFPLAGPLPQMAFEADAHICERFNRTRLEGAPVDPRFSGASGAV